MKKQTPEELVAEVDAVVAKPIPTFGPLISAELEHALDLAEQLEIEAQPLES